MNILYITHCDPRSTDFGSAQRSHLLWKALQEKGTVYTVYNVGPQDPNRVFDAEARIAAVTFLSPNRLVRACQILFGRYCAPAEWPFRSRSFILGQIPWKDVHFDCVVTRYLRTAAQAAAWKIAPLYVDIDDLPSESFATIRRGRYPWPVGALLQKVVTSWQRHVLRKCRGTWIANADQVGEVARICSCRALPNLAIEPAADYDCNGPQKMKLMTVGLMGYEPNYQGVDRFLDTCWPAIHARFPDMTYAIAGGGLSDSLRAKWSAMPNVHVLGYVKDLDALYAESLAVVTPIRSGAGTCIKVIEAALHGRKILATPFAVRGLSDDECESLRICRCEESSTMIPVLEKLAACRDRSAVQKCIVDAARRANSYEAFSRQVHLVGRDFILLKK